MDITSYLLGKQAGGGTPAVLEEKDVTVTSNGESEITPSTGYNGISKVNLTTSVQPNLESKSITIDTNTTTTIEPTQGKDGLSSIEVTTAIPIPPQPSGTISITQNGTGIDVSSYATANVNVQTQMFRPTYYHINYNGGNWLNGVTNIAPLINNVDTSLLTDMSYMFRYGTSLTGTLTLPSSWSNVKCSSYSSMFNGCSSLKKIDLSVFGTAPNKDSYTGPNFNSMFYGCSALTEVDLSNLDISGVSSRTPDIGQMFRDCTSLTKIDMRKFRFHYYTSSTAPTRMLDGVPTTCLIIVKDTTEKNWFANLFPTYTNVKTVAEYEA